MGFWSNVFARFSPSPSNTAGTTPEITGVRMPELPTPGLIKNSENSFSVDDKKLATELGFDYAENPTLWKQVAQIWNTEMRLFTKQSFPPICHALAPILKTPEDWLACSVLLYKTLHEGPERFQVYGNGSLQFLTDTVPSLVSGRSVKNFGQLQEKISAVVETVNPLIQGERMYLKAAQVLCQRPYTAQQIRAELKREMKKLQ
jgi:hypothetical protein